MAVLLCLYLDSVCVPILTRCFMFLGYRTIVLDLGYRCYIEAYHNYYICIEIGSVVVPTFEKHLISPNATKTLNILTVPADFKF